MNKRASIIVGMLSLGFACGAHAAPNAVHEQGFVSIGGIDQWITINGANEDNPVVLFVHGGSGSAMSAYADSLYDGWENDFTLVQWDQRGVGKTYGRSGRATLTLDRTAKDGVEVAEYLAKRLNKQRIVLVGSSWGSLLGVLIVKQRPDLFYAYVGTGQFVDMRANLTASYQRVFELAREFRDPMAIGEIDGIGAPPWKSAGRWQVFRKWRNDFQEKVATVPALKPVRSPQYASAEDLANDKAADELSFVLFNPLMDIDLEEFGPEFRIPVYVIQGGADLSARPDIARKYVKWISAPAKEFILVPGSGHDVSQASLDVLFGVLTHQVRAKIAHE